MHEYTVKILSRKFYQTKNIGWKFDQHVKILPKRKKICQNFPLVEILLFGVISTEHFYSIWH